MTDPVRMLADLFARQGADEYLGEPVTQAAHMLQTAALADAAGAGGALVAAALLHDVGHFGGADHRGDVGGADQGGNVGGANGVNVGGADQRVNVGGASQRGSFTGPVSGHDLMGGTDNRHGDVGADWLATWFPPAMTEPVRLHVAAKRFLCATEPGYIDRLSSASQHTLSVQGGPMSASEVCAFALLPYARDAVALRRWDEAAKDPRATVAPFVHYETVLRSLLSTPQRLAQ
jgi:gamma-butyrobetaine dioxygenase